MEINKRIELPKEAFMNRRELMMRTLSKNVTKRLVKSLVQRVALFRAGI
jgi:hypothetical protein